MFWMPVLQTFPENAYIGYPGLATRARDTGRLGLIGRKAESEALTGRHRPWSPRHTDIGSYSIKGIASTHIYFVVNEAR